MLTKNFYSFMRAALSASGTTTNFTKTDGTTASYSFTSAYYPFNVMKDWASQSDITGVSFGTGTTPPTASDYVLESILSNTQISVAAPNAVSYSRGDTYDAYFVAFGITNKTSEAITISEVGLTASPVTNSACVLVDRTVLDTPVTIPAGQSKQITYTIRFNY